MLPCGGLYVLRTEARKAGTLAEGEQHQSPARPGPHPPLEWTKQNLRVFRAPRSQSAGYRMLCDMEAGLGAWCCVVLLSLSQRF